MPEPMRFYLDPARRSSRYAEILEGGGFDVSRFSPTEGRLLALLLPAGRLVGPADFADVSAAGRMAHRDRQARATDHYLTIAVHRLSRKLPPGWRIANQRGWGYRLQAVPS